MDWLVWIPFWWFCFVVTTKASQLFSEVSKETGSMLAGLIACAIIYGPAPFVFYWAFQWLTRV